MNNLLVIYHEDFLCYEKLKRKIKNITINMDDFKITTTHDKRGILLRLSTEITFELNIVKEVNLNDISHSIIFNCFHEYDEIITEIKEKNIPIRIINLKLAKAINIKGTTFGKGSSETYEYIGRGSKWGNPYSMYENGDDRDEVIRKFKYDFDFDKFLNVKKEDFIHLKGKKLGCFCKPQACHGDVIADYLNSLDDGE